MTEAMASLIIALGKNASDYIMFIENAIRFPRVLTPDKDLVIVLRKKSILGKQWPGKMTRVKKRSGVPIPLPSKDFFSHGIFLTVCLCNHIAVELVP